MTKRFSYMEPQGLTSIEARQSVDGGVYLQAEASNYDEDTMILVHLPPVEARALAAWLLAVYGIPQAALTEVAAPINGPFIAVGYIGHGGQVFWEPGKGPNDLIPDQLVYVSHLPKRRPK